VKQEIINVWTDGCSRGNPGAGGAGVVILLPDGSLERIGEPLGKTTNNQAELHAVRITLEVLTDYRKHALCIHTDSANVIGWLTGAFRANKNVPLIFAVREQMQTFAKVSFKKILGHSGDQHNEAADALANYAATEGPIRLGPGLASRPSFKPV
jgi:ribonuclease HI